MFITAGDLHSSTPPNSQVLSSGPLAVIELTSEMCHSALATLGLSRLRYPLKHHPGIISGYPGDTPAVSGRAILEDDVVASLYRVCNMIAIAKQFK